MEKLPLVELVRDGAFHQQEGVLGFWLGGRTIYGAVTNSICSVNGRLTNTGACFFFPASQGDYTEDGPDPKPDRDIELELSALDADEPDGQGEQIEVPEFW